MGENQKKKEKKKKGLEKSTQASLNGETKKHVGKKQGGTREEIWLEEERGSLRSAAK